MELFRIYKEVTQQPHGYLLIDLTQGINDPLRFRSDIFKSEYTVVQNSLETYLKTPHKSECRGTASSSENVWNARRVKGGQVEREVMDLGLRKAERP